MVKLLVDTREAERQNRWWTLQTSPWKTAKEALFL